MGGPLLKRHRNWIPLSLILCLFLPGRTEEWARLQQQIVREQAFTLPEVNKCGFPLVLLAHFSRSPQLGYRLQAYSRALRQQTYRTHLSPSGRFLIYYQTEGDDAIPTYNLDGDSLPDYLEFVASAFDRAWEVEVEHLGFRPPPDADGLPRPVYPIYCQNLSGTQTYGITFIDQEIPALPGQNYTSHIVINTDFSFVHFPAAGENPILRDSLAIAVTAAHEFNHALQLGYHIWNRDTSILDPVLPDFWFIESSATYMEEVVADTVNDYYQYLPYYMRTLEMSLFQIPSNRTEWIRVYGQVLFPIMLGEVFGASIIREVWENIVEAEAIIALDRVLKQKRSSLWREWQRFARWLYYTGSAASVNRFFPEASYYPSPLFTQTMDLDSVFADRDTLVYGQAPPMSLHYVRVPVQFPGRYFLILQFGAASASLGGVLFQPQWQPMANEEYVMGRLEQKGEFHLAVLGGPWTFLAPDSTVAFWLLGGRVIVKDRSRVRIYPRKWSPQHAAPGITFLNLPQNARVEIFSADGVRIAAFRPDRPIYLWIPRAPSGTLLGSGVYLFRVVAEGFQQQGKFLIVR